MSVAVLGIEGSYSEEAARCFLGSGSRILGCADFAGVFSAAIDGRVRYAVVPVSNTITGRIEAAANLLEKSGFDVLNQVEIQVRHVLAGTQCSAFEHVRTVISHPEALRQCSGFFSRYPELVSVAAEDTATGIRRIVLEGKPELAAIGSRVAAEKHGAKILLEGIADDPENRTTFVLAVPPIKRHRK